MKRLSEIFRGYGTSSRSWIVGSTDGGAAETAVRWSFLGRPLQLLLSFSSLVSCLQVLVHSELSCRSRFLTDIHATGGSMLVPIFQLETAAICT